MVVEIIEGSEESVINLSKEKDLSCGQLQDFFCCKHFLALLYPRQCVFFNWKQREVLLTVKVNHVS